MPEELLLRVTRGAPTADEVAALVGVLLSRRRPAPAAVTAPSRWALSGRPYPGAVPGSGAWRASALPGSGRRTGL